MTPIEFIDALIALAGLRIVAVSTLAAVQAVRSRIKLPCEYNPPLVVLIPARNEERAIVATVSAVLSSEYPEFRVIVINDGSTDSTLDLLQRHFGSNPRVSILSQTQRGKQEALNVALRSVVEEGFVTVDADTMITPHALRALSAHLRNPGNGAVAGNVKVAKPKNLLAKFQAAEYVTLWNWERRALDMLGWITIVPGAIGCWRTDAVRAVSGFSSATSAEDADLTIILQLKGYRIVYEAAAIAYTEAPLDIRTLVRQRIRWTLGNLQAIWRQRQWIGRCGSFGWIGLPNALVFQTVLPLVDLTATTILVVTLCRLIGAHPSEYLHITVYLASFVGGFSVLEAMSATLAFAFERERPPGAFVSVGLQRFVYRPILGVTALLAFWKFLRNEQCDWSGSEYESDSQRVGRRP